MEDDQVSRANLLLVLASGRDHNKPSFLLESAKEYATNSGHFYDSGPTFCCITV